MRHLGSAGFLWFGVSACSTRVGVESARVGFLEAAIILLGMVVIASMGMRAYAQRRYARRLEIEISSRMGETMLEKERLTVTLRNISDGVVTTDAEGAVIYLNPTAEATTGWSREEAEGVPLHEVLPVRRARGDRSAFDPMKLLEERDIDALEKSETVELSSRDGARHLIEISGSPIVRSRGRHDGLVIALRDVTKKHELENELAKAHKLEALGLLAGGIAHDFNNLLTVVLGNLSLLEHSVEQTEMADKQLRDATHAVLRARDLTQQLLTFARGGMPVREAASIREVIMDSASFVLSGSNVRCEVELPDNLWVVDIDAGQISQVINNLLINAMQAMPKGGTVTLRGRNSLGRTVDMPRNRYVTIEVIDQGIGISPENLSRIFDPYFSTKAEGRGLGLASAYSVIRHHDGALTAHSEEGCGTTFRILLPASETRWVAPKSEDVVIPTAGMAGGRILIMDDDQTVLELTATMVEELGYDTATATDGQAAVAAYRQARSAGRPFDAVIMDLTIPGGMGGKEAIQRLVEIDPDVVAIVASGYSNDPVMADFRRHGFAAQLSKPFRVEDLVRVLRRIPQPRHDQAQQAVGVGG